MGSPVFGAETFSAAPDASIAIDELDVTEVMFTVTLAVPSQSSDSEDPAD
jgi:hypothetical protein